MRMLGYNRKFVGKKVYIKAEFSEDLKSSQSRDVALMELARFLGR